MNKINPAKQNTTISKASLTSWTRLFDAVDRVKSLELWKTFCEVDLAEIHLPGDKEPYYCCISGMYELPKGISIYKGHRGLVSFTHYLNTMDLPEYIGESKRACLECTWGARGDLRKRDMEILKSCERKYRGAEAWPLFRKHETGYEPWYLRTDEAEILARVLEELAKAAEQLVLNDNVTVMTAGCRIGRRFDFEAAQYVNEFLPPVEKIEAVTEGYMITDEVLIRRLKKKPVTTGAIEFDMPYLPMSVKGTGKDPRSFFPRMCIVCDLEKQALTEQYMVSRNDDPRDVGLGIMVHHIEEKGRPTKVFVRDPELYGIVAHLCNSLDIEVVFTPAFRMMDTFIDDLVAKLTEDQL
ncbi:MAG: hypothetical protein IKV96_00755 [Firmicutes bacterium]|nr:hypothetical protein [Bacillota bacterium]